MNRPALAFLLLALALTGCGSNSGSGIGSTTSTPSNSWTWEKGSSSVNQAGTYGSVTVAATTNTPGARENAAFWKDSSGNFWLFGGDGYDSSSSTGYLNDLWEYSSSTGEWTWIGGSSSANQDGTYGTLGTASTSNAPGARTGSVTWTDSSGYFWLFGGYGYDASGTLGSLNDMWRYIPTKATWTWMKGSSTAGASGSYGSKGTAAEANVPSGRYRPSSWMDSGGDLWFFGGCQTEDVTTCYNDLWLYNPSLNWWTWVGGSSSSNQPGTYGTEGTGSTSNIPGSRYGAATWTDTSNNFWLFGGYGYDANGKIGFLNDLWEYVSSSGKWTWVAGSNTYNPGGTYGTKGSGSTSNIPGGRIAARAWADSSGNLWLLGGNGYTGTSSGYLNDLWKYVPSSGQWTWVSGSSSANSSGTYGTEGTASTSNTPGARLSAAGWVDSSDQLWLFGGYYYFGPTSGQSGYQNDLWKYKP